MTTGSETYLEHVREIESGLPEYAKKSFENFSPNFVDGGAILEYYQRQWEPPARRLKLINRTPLQLERDRIIHSSALRKQTEKYHVLYNGQRRTVRNYVTHTMRFAQVTRAIARALRLNADFAEAMALGSKVGAVPFVHAAKGAVAEWVEKSIRDIDRSTGGRSFGVAEQIRIGHAIESPDVVTRIRKYLPWLAMKDGRGYSAGQQSYWLLSTNPYSVQALPNTFCPETLYGIWRHTRGERPVPDSFNYRCDIDNATKGTHEIQWSNATYEAAVVQYADDITWVIENINDANDAALLNKQDPIYKELLPTLEQEVPSELVLPLVAMDSGGVYTYFISDFVDYSRKILSSLGNEDKQDRSALRAGREESFIGLSPPAEEQLEGMIQFLERRVFDDERVKRRSQILRSVTEACLGLLYSAPDETLIKLIEEKGFGRWKPEVTDRAKSLISEKVHRVQLAVDILAEMGDHEIYDFVGIQAI